MYNHLMELFFMITKSSCVTYGKIARIFNEVSAYNVTKVMLQSIFIKWVVFTFASSLQGNKSSIT